MRRFLLAGCLLLVAGALLAVIANRAPTRGSAAPERIAAPPSPGDFVPPPALAAALPREERRAVPPPAAATPPAPDGGDPAPASALPTDPNARLRALEPLRRETIAGLGELKGRVAHCDVRDGTVLVTLETLDRSVRIVDVRIEPLPPGDDPRARPEPADAGGDATHCVRSALVRNVFAAPSARAGRRWEMPLAAGAAE